LLSSVAAGFRPWEKCVGVFLSPFGQTITVAICRCPLFVGSGARQN
jgi:hypothetical protein